MDIFQDYRPYTDAEIPAAMRRIVDDPHFQAVAEYVYPDLPVAEVRAKVLSITTVYDLQVMVMRDVLERVMSQSMTEFTSQVSPKLDPEQRYLFVSNHRDIVLDAMLLDYSLHFAGHTMPQITFGSNLMEFPMMADVGRSNKMFRVDRGGSPREFYNKLMLTSRYIRNVLTEQNESVWIAQRNGRTKNGLDKTDPAIIKMFALSGEGDLEQALEPMHIVPVTVSYEWESCDILKTEERFRSLSGPYVKAPGEDVHSILTGVLAPKGRVHLNVGDPITKDEVAFCHNDPKVLASILDRHINAAYRLYPNNMIADAMLRGEELHSPEADAFVAHMQQLSNPNDETLRRLFLEMYANPVHNR